MGAIDRGQVPDGEVRARVAEAFRLEYARVVASVLRIVRDIDAAEEIVQEAFAQALDHWPADGTPDRPGAWLLTPRGAVRWIACVTPAVRRRAPRRSPTRPRSARWTRAPT